MMKLTLFQSSVDVEQKANLLELLTSDASNGIGDLNAVSIVIESIINESNASFEVTASLAGSLLNTVSNLVSSNFLLSVNNTGEAADLSNTSVF